MATWITHLMIADGVLNRFPSLDRRGFCVGNIAPDCNVENEDWTAFTPPREITHWMQGKRKEASDCDAFYEEYITKRKEKIKSAEEYLGVMGYLPERDCSTSRFISISKEEYAAFTEDTIQLVANKFWQACIRACQNKAGR